MIIPQPDGQAASAFVLGVSEYSHNVHVSMSFERNVVRKLEWKRVEIFGLAAKYV